MSMDVKNSLVISLKDTVTGKVTVFPEVHNEVLNNFMTELRGINAMFVSCKLGKGTAPTIPTMTTLSDRIPVPSPSLVQLSLYDKPETYDFKNDFVCFTYPMEFTYAAGSVTDPIREIGFTLGYGQTNSNTISTRIRLADFGFPDLIPSPTEQLTLAYTLKIYVSTKIQKSVVNLDKDGTLVPTTVSYFTYVYGDQLPAAFNNQYESTYITAYASDSVATQLPVDRNTVGIPVVGSTAIGDAWLSYTITVPAASGNWAKGIRSIELSLNSYIEFDPPIVKNSDSVLTLELQFKAPLKNSTLLASAIAATDPTKPVLEVEIDPVTKQLKSSSNQVSFLKPNTYITGIFNKVPGVLTTSAIARGIAIAVDKKWAPVSKVWSYRMVVYISDCIQYRNLMSPTRSGGVPTTGVDYGIRLGLGKAIAEYILNNDPSGTTSNNFGTWVEIVAQFNNSNYRLYLNGVAVINVTDTATPVVYGGFGEIILGGSNANSDTQNCNGVVFNKLSFYNNYLVQPQGLPSEVTRGTLNRTMFLETFSTWPTLTQSGLKGILGTVTINPTSGPGGIPCAEVTSGCIQFLNNQINFYPTEAFTLEFDYQTTASSSSVYPLVLDSSNSATGDYLFSVLHNHAAGLVSVDNYSPGSVSGSVTIPVYGQWNNWVIVYRIETGVPKLYVARDGVVIMTKTYPTDSTAALPIGMGRLLCGTAGNHIVSIPNNNFKIANIRLTRGVIEYFNPSGFTPPAGIKTVLT